MQIRNRSCGAIRPFQPSEGRSGLLISVVEFTLSAISPQSLMLMMRSVVFNTSIHSTSGSPNEGVASTNNSVIVNSRNATFSLSVQTILNTVSISPTEIRRGDEIPSCIWSKCEKIERWGEDVGGGTETAFMGPDIPLGGSLFQAISTEILSNAAWEIILGDGRGVQMFCRLRRAHENASVFEEVHFASKPMHLGCQLSGGVKMRLSDKGSDIFES